MIKKVKRTKKINKMISSALVLVMVLLLIIPGINDTLANQDVAEKEATILYFEQEDTVLEVWVEIGTSREELGLPAVLRAVLTLESENNKEDNDPGSQTATVTSLTDTGQINGYVLL